MIWAETVKPESKSKRKLDELGLGRPSVKSKNPRTN